MTTSRKQRSKAVESPSKCHVSPDSIGVKKPPITKSLHYQKPALGMLPSTSGRLLDQQLAATQSSSMQTIDQVPTTKNSADQSRKIKLQLFPIDEVTREGLEKDGYNPFLELTLRARKKISSVLKHIHTKWGSSSVAQGEPMLVPYEMQLEKCFDKKWTLKDTWIRAGDVYAAIDMPTIFRLRYGWFSNLEPQIPSNCSYSLETIIGSEGIPKSGVTKLELTSELRNEFDARTAESEKPYDMRKTADEDAASVVAEQMSANEPVKHLVDGVKMDNNVGQSVVPWDDCLTNLSIGGLFSEASLLAKVDKCKSNQIQQQSEPIQKLFSEASLQEKINFFASAINGSRSSFHTTDDKGLAQPTLPGDDNLTDLSIGGLLSEASLLAKIEKCKSNQIQQQLEPVQLTSDISMGKLFSEASLQEKINNFGSAINGSKSSFRTTADGLAQPTFPCDNLITLSIGGLPEASLKGKIQSHSQPAKPSLHDSHSSILDAEETCHAFAIQKFSLSSKGDLASSQEERPGSWSHDTSKQVDFGEGPPYQEPKTDRMPGSRIHNEDNSLGLSGIRWNDSFGPFDLGLSQQFMGGDSSGLRNISQ